MNRKSSAVMAGLVFILALSGCLSDSLETGQSLDDLITEIAVRTVALLPRETGANLAVYYFTVDGKKSPLSDHLINGLTTEMANLVPQGYKVLSRPGLDRIMEEHSFQLTDLVSEETRVDLGQMLGADVIITGFITSLGEVDKINVQIIQVLTGAVLGGFTLDYHPEQPVNAGGSGEIIRVEKIYPEARGMVTVTTIYEDFDGPVPEIAPVPFEDFWGSRVNEVTTQADIDPEGFAFLDFSAEIAPLEDLTEWGDTDVNWYVDFPLDRTPGEFYGFSLRVRPQGFSRLALFIKQQAGEETTLFAGTVTVNPEEWTRLAVPFDALGFREGAHRLDPDEPLSIGLGISYLDNYGQYHFREGVKGRLSVDDLGMFKLDEPSDPSMASGFEDEVSRVLGTFRADGSDLFVDYSQTDLGVIRKNRGVSSQVLNVAFEDDGPAGRYLRLSGYFEVTPEISEFLASDQEINLVLDLAVPGLLAQRKNLSFMIRSDLASSGVLQITAPVEGLYGEKEFVVNQGWRRVRIPLAGEMTDSDYRSEGPEPMSFRFLWTVPAEKLRQAVGNRLSFTLDLDEIWFIE